MTVSIRRCLRPRCGTLVLAAAALCAGREVATQVKAGAAETPLHEAVEFNRDIRPILSESCFNCHGPDEAKREADLRFDTQEGALAERDGRRAIVPGDAPASEMYRRITAENPEERMPPTDSGRVLDARQIELIRRWIDHGAKWQKHWAFIAPARLDLPRVTNESWVRNAIDAFVLARLEREGLTPAAEAERTTLIRRLSLDLTGLPPTPAEVDAFLADDSRAAYEALVDRLLASPRYGERMAVRWLDGARYADTSGYQNDGPRFMWRWRDWVIDAFNANMPFDQFTIEQIAGDMLPNATLDQKIATGFNRNHRGNAEGGIIPEEYAVEYVVDRVDTTFTVWLGLTMACARCHDHKFDPVLQREFYQAFAYFNNVPEFGRAIKEGNSPPIIRAPTREDEARLRQLDDELARAQRCFAELENELATAQSEWEKSLSGSPPINWSPAEGLVAHYQLDGSAAEASSGAVEASFHDGESTYTSGMLGQAVELDGRLFIDAGDVGQFGYFDKFSLAAWIRPHGDRGGTILSRMTDVEETDGYYLVLKNGRLQVNLVKRWLDDAIRVETEASLEPENWHHVMVTYDGSAAASGIRIYVDGQEEPKRVHLDFINQSFSTKEPLRIGGGGGPQGRFHGAIDDVRVYKKCLSAEEVGWVATPDPISDTVATPAEARTPRQAAKLRAYYLLELAPAEIRGAHQELAALERQKEQFLQNIPTVMVMEEMPMPRETHVLLRGEYNKLGERVSPGVPACLFPLPNDAPANRLGFARWLVDRSNPLTARVAVNRFWQMYFGTGLVKTVDDFGAQGEPPSHPELLDWLATELIASRWDVKALQKLIVTSATYRQSSNVPAHRWQRDPENRLLARGARVRLPAQTIRDQALFASGLLVERLGGPSVKPYQPDGLWRDMATDTEYNQDHGENLYRRSLYTYWKRTVAPPTMMTFDASSRETCVVRETRTNTPLQALTLMNDVTFVEASRVLAQRVMIEGGTTHEERITLAFRLATSRRPRPAELDILLASFQHYLAEYRQNLESARQLVSAGEFPRNEQLDLSELASYTAVASAILNLDEVVTKE